MLSGSIPAAVGVLVALSVWGGAAQAEGVATPDGLPGLVALDALPVPRSEALAKGREVWGGTCINCHNGMRYAGAPKITSLTAWSPRLAKGLPVLVQHATEGFVGPKFTEMPARGGAPHLTDRDVAAAVAFMIWASGGAEDALAYTQSPNFPRD